MGLGRKVDSNARVRPFVVLHLILSAPRGGGSSRDFNTNLAPQCRAFSRALEIETLKAPLFCGPMWPGIQMTGALLS